MPGCPILCVGSHAHMRTYPAHAACFTSAPHPVPPRRTNPLPADAVLVDEASMLSLPLAAALMDALKPKCQLVLVGDVDQLPPVGE